MFVSDRKQARITALDAMTMASAEHKENRFLHKFSPEEIQELASKSVRDTYLKHVLKFGIGFISEGMPESEKKLVRELFEAGVIQLLVATYKLAWEL